MDSETLQAELEDAGEILVVVEEFDEPFELHLHDTAIDEETISLTLADGELTFAIDAVTGYWKHYHSLDDYKLD